MYAFSLIFIFFYVTRLRRKLYVVLHEKEGPGYLEFGLEVSMKHFRVFLA